MSNKITTGQETNQKTLFQDLMTRGVPHILGIYLAAGWAVLQFIDWVVNRYILSPHLVDFTLTSIVSFIPSILILAYFHGKPGKDDWTKIEKIVEELSNNNNGDCFEYEMVGNDLHILFIDNEEGYCEEMVFKPATSGT